ncbi:MAG: phosphatase [Muribaculaceae bacterium]|nr:phosphatase [Muribaculaceae bacterium]
MKDFKPTADLHTHTIVSGHAYSSLQEMARAAADMGIEILGVTEHGPAIPGTCGRLYFKNMIVIPREMYGVKLLLGAELNILNYKGDLDADDALMDMLDLRIAGIHSVCWEGGTRSQNTEGVARVINDPRIHIISHPADGSADLDFGELVKAAKNARTLLEINSHSLNPARHKTIARPNNIELLRQCKKHDMPVILGSDAHISFQIADYSNVLPLLDETDFPQELVLNDKPAQLMEYLGLKV